MKVVNTETGRLKGVWHCHPELRTPDRLRLLPGAADVVFGRGRTIALHAGAEC